MTRDLFTTNHREAQDPRTLIDLTDLELQAAIRAGRPGALTEESLRLWCARHGVPRKRFTDRAGKLRRYTA